MKIDRTNYEAFFIDLIDGKLSGKELDNVLDFIEQNPDLAEELKNLKVLEIPLPEDELFDYTKLLKTDFDQPDILEETCIRAIENDLSDKEKEHFQQYLKTSIKAQNELRLFKATISVPNLNEVFRKKSTLKKQRLVVLKFVPYVAAAVLILAFFLFSPTMNMNNPSDFKQQKANVENRNKIDATSVLPDKIELANAELDAVESIENEITSAKIITTESTEESAPIFRKTENPELLAMLTPIDEKAVAVAPKIQLIASNKLTVNSEYIASQNVYYPTIKEHLALGIDELKEKNKGKIGEFALVALKRISGDKINYATTANGKIEKVEFNSRILAFSIPVKTSNN